MFDIQRTMREAYDKARRVLFESSSKAPCADNSCTSPAHKSSHVDVVSNAVAMTMPLSNTGHRGDCPSTCTCFLVCTFYVYCFKFVKFFM